MERSVFPTTQATLLITHMGEAVSEAERLQHAASVRHALMARYAEPLAVFVRGSSLARLGEPAEIVNGFFALRLSDDQTVELFITRYLASGMPLRRWLMNGILFYGQGLSRDQDRARARDTTLPKGAWSSVQAEVPTAEDAFDQACALALVREATARAQAQLSDEGRARDFEIFRRHAVEGKPYAQFARELDRTEAQCAGSTRLVAQRVTEHLAELLREEGIAEEDLEAELRRLRAALQETRRG